MKASAKTVVLVVISLTACPLVLEGGVRLYSALWFPKMMVLDDRLGWKHAANVQKQFVNELGENAVVIHNAHGHRGKEYPFQKEKGKYRVLVVGDSFTEGAHVGEGELFTALLEGSNPRLEVMNAGVGAYGTVQEYLYVATEGIHFNPDLVLLMVYENDLIDNCLSYYPGVGPRPYAMLRTSDVQIIEDPAPDEFLKYTLPVPFSLFLNKHSYLFYYLNANVYHKLFSAKLRKLEQADVRKTDSCGRYEVYYGIVEKMRELLDRSGIALALVLIPSRESVNQGQSKALQPMVEHCQRTRLDCLSLLERFLETGGHASQQFYFPVDIHWTKAGHRAVASEISSLVHRIMPGPTVAEVSPRSNQNAGEGRDAGVTRSDDRDSPGGT